jgi:hypothetical protein
VECSWQPTRGGSPALRMGQGLATPQLKNQLSSYIPYIRADVVWCMLSYIDYVVARIRQGEVLQH